jgi:ABC-type Na+ efflux pump permease subunit
MKKVSELLLVVASTFFVASLQAHEGHAIVGSMAHELEHAGWIAGALMLASVLMLMVFNVAVCFADKQLSDKKRRD